MEYVILWFILIGGLGYLPPMEVRNPPCGVAGEKVGVTFDRAVNPTTVYWPDPYFPGAHCTVDIRAKVSSLQPGTYELATTEMGNGSVVPYIGIDPHTSTAWVKAIGTAPAMPPTLGISGTGMQLPATRILSWDANDPAENVVGYLAYKDGVAYPQTAATQQTVLLSAYAMYEFAVRAIDADGDMSPPATLTYTLEAPPPPPPPACGGITIRVEDWTRTTTPGGRGKVALTLIGSQPIVLLQVRLGGQVIGEVTGSDLRDLAGLYFSVPRTLGSYNIAVSVKDSNNCTTQTTATRAVVVQ